MRRVLTVFALIVTAASGQVPAADSRPANAGPEGMVWIPGGEFTMGTRPTRSRAATSSPPHRVRVDGFWMDETEVTNAQFAEFVDATGYVTTAERPVDWEELKKQVAPGTPKPPDEKLRARLARLHAARRPRRPATTISQWWNWTPGADWRHPEGPGAARSTDKDDHPGRARRLGRRRRLLQVGRQAACRPRPSGNSPRAADSTASATCGATSRLERQRAGQHLAGRLPRQEHRRGRLRPDRAGEELPAERLRPVRHGRQRVGVVQRPRIRPDTYARRVLELGPGGVAVNPVGPSKSLDPRNPLAPESHVHRGGSFLCHDSYCASYRPSARMACPPDTALEHLGFRCVMTAEMWKQRTESRPVK